MSHVALFDLDGTLADFHGAMKRDLAILRGPKETIPSATTWEDEELPENVHIKARADFIKRQPNWWANLDRLQDGFRVLEIARSVGYRIHICTRASSRHPSVWGQKVEWVVRHVPDAQITITQDKGLIYGRVLVDDWPSYIKRWVKHRPRGLVIMPDRPWNRDYTHPQVVRLINPNDPPTVPSGRGKRRVEPAPDARQQPWTDSEGLRLLLKAQYDRKASGE